MKTLYQIKDEVVKEKGYAGWGDFMLCVELGKYDADDIMDNVKDVEFFMEIVARRYALQAIDEAAEKAVLKCVNKEINKEFSQEEFKSFPGGTTVTVDKQSIIDVKNELK